MNKEDRQKLREAAISAQAGVRDRTPPSIGDGMRWELQTSNSFRRIGQHRDGDVLCAIKLSDGQPSLSCAYGVLDYIVAAQPSVVLELLDCIDTLELLTTHNDSLIDINCGMVTETIRVLGEQTRHLHEQIETLVADNSKLAAENETLKKAVR